MLITEKSGILYVASADGQQRKRVDGIPSVASEGQGGFMDVVLHPAFPKNRLANHDPCTFTGSEDDALASARSSRGMSRQHRIAAMFSAAAA